MNRLDLYLANHYAAAQIGRGDPKFTEKALRDMCEADADFRKEAQDRLAALAPVLKRDHIARVHHDILTRVLTA